MRGEQIVYLDFSGGVNAAAAPYLLEENQCRDALNIQTDLQGTLRKRQGFTVFASMGTSPASFTGSAHSLAAVSPAGTPYLLAVGVISGSDDRVVSVTAGGTVTDRTPGALPYTTNKKWYIAQAPASGGQGPVFAMNGTDTPQQWTGSGNFADWTASSGTVPVSGKFLTHHGSRLWCAETSVAGRIRYSGITGTAPDVRVWDANDYVDLEKDDGQEITGIAPLGPYLLVFKPRKTFVIYDLVTGANRQISDTVGCIAHRSCVDTPVGLFFLDEEQGVMLTDGSQIECVSEPVNPLLDALSAAKTGDAAACYHDGRYFISYSTNGTDNNKTLEYDTTMRSWWPHSCTSNEWALLDPIGTPKLYTAATTTQSILQAFVPGSFIDRTSPYESYVTGPHLIWDQPHLQKRTREVRVDGSGEWTLGYAIDYEADFTEDSGEVWQTTEESATLFAPAVSENVKFAPTVSQTIMFAPTSDAVTSRRYYTLGVGRAWSFRLRNTDAADFQVYSMTAAVTRRED